MTFTQAKGHFYKQYLKLFKAGGEWEFILVYPLVHLFSMGFLSTFVGAGDGARIALTYMFVGAFSWNFYVLAQKGITYGILHEIWADSVKHLATAPAGITEFIVGNGSYGLLSGLLAWVLMALCAQIFFAFNIFTAGPVLALGLAGLFLYGIAEGLIVNAIMLLKGPEYMSITWIITGIVMVTSAVYYPLSILPEPIRTAALVLPTTHAIESIRQAILGGDAVTPGINAVALGIIYLLVASVVFTKALKRSKQNGTILRL